jgi:recombination protein RecR
MDPISQLADLFQRFPGIGPRQAKRFVYFLLRQNGGYIRELTHGMQELQSRIARCAGCRRYFTNAHNAAAQECAICGDSARDSALLMVVEKDVDIEAIEKSGSFNGRYFVLGGTISVLEKEPEKRIAANELFRAISERAQHSALKEIILALSLNEGGETTAAWLRSQLAPLVREHALTISSLGRGLSTGLELEYSDVDTIQNALHSRVQDSETHHRE